MQIRLVRMTVQSVRASRALLGQVNLLIRHPQKSSVNSRGVTTQWSLKHKALTSLSEAEKHDVQSTECESDPEFTDISDEVNLLGGESKDFKHRGEYHTVEVLRYHQTLSDTTSLVPSIHFL